MLDEPCNELNARYYHIKYFIFYSKLNIIYIVL